MQTSVRENISSFIGPYTAKELDAVFEQSDMGIGSLARHRSGIDKNQDLKKS